MEETTGVLRGFYKTLLTSENDTEKNKILRAMLQYVLERKPTTKEYAMLFKIVKDYGYDIAFSALEFLRYSNADLSKNYWGLMVWKCRELLRSSTDEMLVDNRLQDVIKEYNAFRIDDIEERREKLGSLYEPV